MNTYKISRNRKNERILHISSPVGVDKIFDEIGGYGFDGFCEKRESYVAFAKFQLSKVNEILAAKGYVLA